MNETNQGQSQVDAHLLKWGLGKLIAAFPGSFPDERATEERALLWRELLDSHPWVTPDVFRKGVYALTWQHKGDYVPPPAVALDYFHAALQEVRRETEKQLPPPEKAPPPDSPGQVSAKQAARRLLQERYGFWKGRPLTEEEAAAAHRRRGAASRG